ncbi:MAG: DUF1684 domain-containing protein [Roseivirga sp.]
MGRQKIFVVLIVAIVAITVINFMSTGEGTEEYISRIEEDRKTRNGFMVSSSSPFTVEDRKTFTNLNYYPVKEEFKILAKLTRVQRKQPIFIPTTTGESKKYIPYGYAEFEIDGKPQKLLLYQDWEENNPNKLSLMFADNTSGDTTYGGGRYIDVPRSNTNAITIDFNMAYNPFCHFNDEYSCPIPPKENLLTVAIEAGEKLYKEL